MKYRPLIEHAGQQYVDVPEIETLSVRADLQTEICRATRAALAPGLPPRHDLRAQVKQILGAPSRPRAPHPIRYIVAYDRKPLTHMTLDAKGRSVPADSLSSRQIKRAIRAAKARRNKE